ncbi:MAG TPA: ankyrin repeat domain-containing protein [Thermoanaerobaculia bacterium]|nr:ankyrin repeat domain-containing protein [Thermoanaerobaculia bacterium]
MRIIGILARLSLSLILLTSCRPSAERLNDAAAAGDTKAVVSILAEGADVNSQVDGVTALMAAALTGQAQTARALIQHGADPNVVGPHRNTALMGAVGRNQIETATVLIRAGADVNAKDADGATVLMIAASNGFEDIVRLLVAAGAVRETTDSNGQTALKWAEQNGHASVVEILRTWNTQAGATMPMRGGRNSEYRDKERGMSLWYPSGWRIMSPEQIREKTKGLLDVEGALVFLVNEADADQNINIKSYKVPRAEASPTELEGLARTMDKNPQHLPGFSKIYSGIVPVSGQDALEYVLEVRRGRMTLRQRSVLLIKNGRDYVITFTAPKELYNNADRACFQTVQSTFRVQ